MIYKLSEHVSDTQCLIKDGTFECLALSNSKPGMKFITFAEAEEYLTEITSNPDVQCVICKEEFVDQLKEYIEGIVVSKEPRLDYFRLHNRLANTVGYALSSHETKIGMGCCISDLAYIDPQNVIIGNNVTIEEFVSIRGPVTIGDNTVIKSGSQIGGDGFEFKQNGDTFYNVIHCGKTTIGRNVVIWPNVTIHKAVYSWDETLVGDYSNINSRVHIDHGAKIYQRCEICAGAIISGRVVLEPHAFIGPGAVISNRIVVGRNAKVSLGAVVTKDVSPGSVVSGNFAIDHNAFISNLRRIR